MADDFGTMSTAESFDDGPEKLFVLHSPGSNARASSSFLLSKRDPKRVDLTASLPPGHYGEASGRGSDKKDHRVTVGGTGSFSSHDFDSMRSMRTSRFAEPAHSSAYGSLRRYNSASTDIVASFRFRRAGSDQRQQPTPANCSLSKEGRKAVTTKL
jgi:hypothetical protein